MRAKTLLQLMAAVIAGAVLMAVFMLYFAVCNINEVSPIERGRELAQLLCADCHAIGQTGESNNPRSPPFRTLEDKLTTEGISDEISEGLILGHEPMPPWNFSARQADDLLSYIVNLGN